MWLGFFPSSGMKGILLFVSASLANRILLDKLFTYIIFALERIAPTVSDVECREPKSSLDVGIRSFSLALSCVRNGSGRADGLMILGLIAQW